MFILIKQEVDILRFVDCASLYNLLNNSNMVHKFSLSVSICFGQLCAHHQEKQRYL